MHWLEKYNTSIVLAVTTAERGLQCEIVRMIMTVPRYAANTLLVVTKPKALGASDGRVVKLLESEQVRSVSRGMIVIHSVDTATSEASDMTIEAQVEAENDYFDTHPQYQNHRENCGVDTLRNISLDLFLQSACRAIPELQNNLRTVQRGMRLGRSYKAYLILGQKKLFCRGTLQACRSSSDAR